MGVSTYFNMPIMRIVRSPYELIIGRNSIVPCVLDSLLTTSIVGVLVPISPTLLGRVVLGLELGFHRFCWSAIVPQMNSSRDLQINTAAKLYNFARQIFIFYISLMQASLTVYNLGFSLLFTPNFVTAFCAYAIMYMLAQKSAEIGQMVLQLNHQ